MAKKSNKKSSNKEKDSKKNNIEKPKKVAKKSKKKENPPKLVVPIEPKKKKESKKKVSVDEVKKESPKKKRAKKVEKPEKEKKKGGFFPMTSRTKLSDNDCPEFLKGECKNEYCKNIHNFSLINKLTNNEEFARRYYTLAQDFMVIEPYERKLYARANLDLMFIMDCTGSMGSWIESAKKELNSIIDYIKDTNPYSKVRVSFIGYRDHCDKTMSNIFGKISNKREENSKYEMCGINRDQFSYIDFDEDIEKIKYFISGVSAYGGGDLPEDVAGGLKIGLEQNWESAAKYCVLVCDAPCHGSKYHDVFGDSYPKGDPNGLIIEDLIQEYARRDINFYAVKIDKITEKMFKIMSNSYQDIAKKPITISDLGTSTDKFGFFVAFGAANTLSSVTMNGFSLKDFLNMIKKDSVVQGQDQTLSKDAEVNNIGFSVKNNEKNTQLQDFVLRINTLMGEAEDEIKPLTDEDFSKLNGAIPMPSQQKTIVLHSSYENINKIDDYKIIKLDYEVPDVIHPPKNWDTLSKKILNVICHSYYITKDRNSEINWKNPLVSYSSIKSKVLLDNKPFSSGAMRYAFYMRDKDLEQNLVAKIPKEIDMKEYTVDKLAKELEAITICQHLVSDFNERIVNIIPDTRLLLHFVNCWIYEVLDGGLNLFSVENYIEGYYEKYNNNAGWINSNLNESALIAQAFSHFSWQITKGYLMIVDLQGVQGVLTDPQIHCLNIKKFGKGNLGYMGMMKFFMSHMCNSYCRKLSLVHPRNKKTIDKDYDFFVEKFVPPTDETMIWKLCDLCRKPFMKNSKELYELRKKCWEAFCGDCDEKRKASWERSNCVDCHTTFTSSSYWFKMKRQAFPDKCMKCRLDKRAKDRKDHQNNIQEGEAEIPGVSAMILEEEN